MEAELRQTRLLLLFSCPLGKGEARRRGVRVGEHRAKVGAPAERGIAFSRSRRQLRAPLPSSASITLAELANPPRGLAGPMDLVAADLIFADAALAARKDRDDPRHYAVLKRFVEPHTRYPQVAPTRRNSLAEASAMVSATALLSPRLANGRSKCFGRTPPRKAAIYAHWRYRQHRLPDALRR